MKITAAQHLSGSARVIIPAATLKKAHGKKNTFFIKSVFHYPREMLVSIVVTS